MAHFAELRVPDEQEFLETFGLEADPDDSTGRVFAFDLADGEQVVFSYDVAGRSVRCRWSRNGTMVLDLFREGAILIIIESSSALRVDFEGGELRGQLRIQLLPSVAVQDHLLFV